MRTLEEIKRANAAVRAELPGKWAAEMAAIRERAKVRATSAARCAVVKLSDYIERKRGE